MKENLEFEIKSKIDSSNKKLNEFISQLPEAFADSFIIDKYFDTENFDLYKMGIFLRNRNNKHIEIKHDSDRFLTHTHTNEFKYDLPLSNADSLKISLFLKENIKESNTNSESVLTRFGLVELTTIEKRRKEFKINNLIFSIDDVTTLGRFVEIEANSEEDYIELKKLALSLGLKNMEVGYVELMLHKQNLKAYKTGRYQLKNYKY